MNTAGKVRPLGDAARWRAALPAGTTVVFTNGVFDLLHAGHVALLEAARAAGGALIVAVNSDASVRRLGKGGRGGGGPTVPSSPPPSGRGCSPPWRAWTAWSCSTRTRR